MQFFVDEAGSFAPALGGPGSWCVIAAYVIAEHQVERALATLAEFKQAAGMVAAPEVKRSDVADPEIYFRFLRNLHRVGGIAACVATDAGLYNALPAQQRQQADLVRTGFEHLEPEQRDKGDWLAQELVRLSPQLFADLICRVEMAHRAVQLATLYFVRRSPETLATFRWRFDEKGRIEPAFRRLWAGVAQALSVRDPLRQWSNADYTAMERYRRAAPLGANIAGRWYDASSLCLDDLDFVVSHGEPGVQIADLIASGVRKCLRGEFGPDNVRAASLLGRLMRKVSRNEQVVPLILFAPVEPDEVAVVTRRAVNEMSTWARLLA